METLFAKQDRLLSLTSTEIIRTLMYQGSALLYAGLCLFLQSYFVGVGGCVCEKWREASLLGRGT